MKAPKQTAKDTDNKSRLAELKSLKDEGIISEDEHDKQREKIISGI